MGVYRLYTGEDGESHIEELGTPINSVFPPSTNQVSGSTQAAIPQLVNWHYTQVLEWVRPINKTCNPFHNG